jgi:hypothetical protein
MDVSVRRIGTAFQLQGKLARLLLTIQKKPEKSIESD